jgi:putative FmdB family regulatory protein
MPLYLFKCKKCNITKEVNIEIKELDNYKNNMRCDKCNGKMTLVPSNCNFILKGKGWYKDGYN